MKFFLISSAGLLNLATGLASSAVDDPASTSWIEKAVAAGGNSVVLVLLLWWLLAKYLPEQTAAHRDAMAKISESAAKIADNFTAEVRAVREDSEKRMDRLQQQFRDAIDCPQFRDKK